MSMGTGTLDGFLVSMGGFGTHTNITLFLPTLGMKWNEMKWNEMKWNEIQPNPTQIVDLGKSYSYLLIEKRQY